jgi:hypothetical protein
MRLLANECFGLDKKWLLLSGIATSLMLVSVPVQAATIQAEVDWTLAGTPGATSPDIDGPATSGSVDVLAGDSDSSGNNVFYHTYGDVGGTFGSRVSGDGNYDITGLFTYQETFVNPNPFPSPASFSFNIIPGELSAFLSSGYTPAAGDALLSRYEIDIRLNGTSIWDSSATLSYDGGTNMFSFADTGTNSLGGTFSSTPTSAIYSFGPYSNTIALGTFAAGETFLLEYDLKAIATGNLPNTCMDGQPEGNGEINPEVATAVAANIGVEPGQGACGGSTARSGDPFDPTFGNTGTVTGAVPATATVPEPSNLFSFLALAGGIAGSSILRRYRRK